MSDGTTLSLDATAEVEALRQHYRFRDDAEVSAFLARRPGLIDLLTEAASRVYDFFPRDSNLVLEMIDDPDDEESPPDLFAVVETSLPLPEAMSRLYRFRAEWWRQASAPFVRDIAFTAE